MSLLTISARQNLLQKLGFYTGKVDGIEGAKTREAYKAVQKAYFTRMNDIDGIYGKNTDILLRNLLEFQKSPHFKIEEFQCHCMGKYCTGYPVVIDYRLLEGLEKIRTIYDKPIHVKSGFRCVSHNAAQAGSSKSSRHLSGKAADIQIAGHTTTEKGRTDLINLWYTKVKGRYAYGNIKGSHPNMGSSVHVDVK